MKFAPFVFVEQPQRSIGSLMVNKLLTSASESREIPIRTHVDVLVAGGGPAGFAAALCAARAGAKTLLVERYGYLGGMMTGARIVAVMAVGDGTRPVARGVVEDIRQELHRFGGVNRERPDGDYCVDAEIFKWRAAEMLLASGAEMLLHTLACGPILADDRVRGVFTESKNGRGAIGARVVIDCTADGDIAFRAGAACTNRTHRVTLVVFLQGVDRERERQFAESDPERHKAVTEEAKRLNGGFLPAGRSMQEIDITDAAALTHAEIVMRRGCFEALNYLRAHMPGWEHASVAETCPQLGVRQSRLIEGLYTLTRQDIGSNRRFEDAIARLGKGYDIPYRSLVPKGLRGLLAAGRCISCDYEAADILRLIAPCLVTGQAAGVAAALATQRGIDPDDLPADALCAALIRQNAYLGGADDREQEATGSVPDPEAAGMQKEDTAARH